MRDWRGDFAGSAGFSPCSEGGRGGDGIPPERVPSAANGGASEVLPHCTERPKENQLMNFEQAINIEDLHRIAKRKLPKIIFDYIEGGVEDERGLARKEAALHKHPLLPRYLVDVSKRDQSTTVFGRTYSSPFGISPTGGVGLYRREGGGRLARAATAGQHPLTTSGGRTAP